MPVGVMVLFCIVPKKGLNEIYINSLGIKKALKTGFKKCIWKVFKNPDFNDSEGDK